METLSEIITAYGTFDGHICLADNKEAPIILFLHGFPDDSKVWGYQIEALKNDFEIWAPNLYQHSFNDQINGLSSHLKSQANGRPVILVGHDMGGPVACEIALLHPELISKVLLINTVSLKQFIGRWNNPRQWLKSFYIPLFAGPLHMDFWQHKMGKRFLKTAYDKGGLDKSDPIRNNSLEVLVGIKRYREVVKKLSHYVSDMEKRLKTQTHFLYGINDPFLMTPDYDELTRHFQDVKLDLLPTGHWPQRNCPDEVNKWIKKAINDG